MIGRIEKPFQVKGENFLFIVEKILIETGIFCSGYYQVFAL